VQCGLHTQEQDRVSWCLVVNKASRYGIRVGLALLRKSIQVCALVCYMARAACRGVGVVCVCVCVCVLCVFVCFVFVYVCLCVCVSFSLFPPHPTTHQR
jgi:hypothetical protein